MKKLSQLALIPVVMIMLSCGGSGGSPVSQSTQPPTISPAPKGLLIEVKSQNQLLQTVRQSFSRVAADNMARASSVETVDGIAMDVDGSAPASSESFTTTYTLEASVDEHDYVKYDGNHLFIAPSRGMDCCFIVDDIDFMAPSSEESASVAADVMPISSANEERSIRILSTDPGVAKATQVSTIPLSGSRTVEGLYSNDDQLVSISSSGWWGVFGDAFVNPSIWAGQTTAMDIYDISDITNPDRQLQLEFQGGFVSSRRQGDMVYLVARHTPQIDRYNYYPDSLQVTENEALLEALKPEDILPNMAINGVESPLLSASDCRVTDSENSLAPESSGFPTMTILIAVDLASQSVANAVCYLEPTSGIYVSNNAIYLTQVDYAEADSRTLVHSYALSSELDYLGSGVVDGALALSGDRDFRINEHDGYLRLVTSQRTVNAEDRIDHQLSVLKLATDKPQLNLVATLPNAERTAAIGKPNEDLYGARFFGDKLYLVTFERIDPLYVLDLSDPLDPLIAGELSVTGFSDFLHPVNDELLLGLGQDEQGLVKLELFNVESLTAPFSLGSTSLTPGVSWSYSEARYNRHAFTYQAIDETTDRFSVPVSLSLYSDEAGYSNERRLFLFEIHSKDRPADASIFEVGQIVATTEQWWDSRQRAVFDGDAVFYIDGTAVWSALWGVPESQDGPF
ncbi:hypothetical protein U062_02071 [Gammaproteobacteria bacterium MOLA455]|nr:hypothetical protein U062_02071 [Gammaproteobacteria bacterium MOLA455]